jgi:hypothetical protein
MTRIKQVAAAVLATLMLSTIASAQEPSKTAVPPMPAPDALLMMIRSHVYAVGLSNAAGTYEPLRALGSTQFKATNSADALTKTFEQVRALNLDLSPVLVTTPVLTDPPAVIDGKLRVFGTFPTAPVEIPFGIMFEQDGGTWRLNAISVGARPAAKTAELTTPMKPVAAPVPAKKK